MIVLLNCAVSHKLWGPNGRKSTIWTQNITDSPQSCDAVDLDFYYYQGRLAFGFWAQESLRLNSISPPTVTMKFSRKNDITHQSERQVSHCYGKF
jgi:hypothetical protein